MPIDEQTIAELRGLYEKAGSGEVFVYRDEDGFAIALADHLHRRDIAKFGVPYRKITRDWIEGHASLLEGLLNALPALLTAASNEARLQRLYDGQQDLIEDQASKLHAAQMEAETLRAALKWKPTHRHLKRGSSYQVIGSAVLQTAEPIHDAYIMTVYAARDGTLWVRPTAEFNDGRFEQITPPAASEEDAS